MFGLVLNALRARRAQTVAMFVLTALAGLGASAAPWFAGWARDAVVDANIVGRAGQRNGWSPRRARSGTARKSRVRSQALRDRVAPSSSVPGADVVIGARLYTNMARPRAPPPADRRPVPELPRRGLRTAHDRRGLPGRDRRCPAGPEDGRVELGLTVGDPVRFEGFRLATPVTLRISGLYEVADLLSAYWAGAGPAGRAGRRVIGAVVDEPAFVSRGGSVAAGPDGLDMDFHLVAAGDRLPRQADPTSRRSARRRHGRTAAVRTSRSAPRRPR